MGCSAEYCTHPTFFFWHDHRCSLPVKNFGERQNIGVRNDHGDAASPKHITQDRLAQASSAKDHTESSLLQHLRVIEDLVLVAALPGGGDALGEIGALVQD